MQHNKLSLYGYEGYQIIHFTGYFFNKNNWNRNSYRTRFIYDYGIVWTGRKSCPFILRTEISKAIIEALTSYKDKEEKFMKLGAVKGKEYVPKQGDTLYFDKKCKIPRIKIEGIWNRTTKIEKADVVVIPKIEDYQILNDYLIFCDENAKVLYLGNVDSKLSDHLSEGMTMQQLHSIAFLGSSFAGNRAVEDENYQRAKASKLIYKGDLVAFPEGNTYAYDIIDGIIPKFIFENKLISLIDRPDEKFDAEAVDGIISLLESKDDESVKMGMRTLANMDYTHYISIARYILHRTEHNWYNHKPFNSAANFMLDSIYKGTRSTTPFSDVTKEEFELCKPIIESIMKGELRDTVSYLCDRTNLKLDFTYDVKVSYPENKPDESGFSDEEVKEMFEGVK